jgi:hypothetical protein
MSVLRAISKRESFTVNSVSDLSQTTLKMATTVRRPYLFPIGSQVGVDNLVLHAVGRRHKVSDFPGPLSIKTVVRGAVSWIVGGREPVVDPISFLLGDGETTATVLKVKRTLID